MNPLHGIALKIASVFFFVVMQSLIKASAPHIPAGEAMFFRSIFAIPPILAWLAWTRQLRQGLRMASPLAHLWRGTIGTVSMGLSFFALGLLPLPEAMALGYTAPLLAVIFAGLFLGETVRLFRHACVGAGMVGVLIILAPRLGGIGTPAEALGAVCALAGAVCAAGAIVTVRAIVATESTSAIVFWFSVTATVLSLVTLPFGWVWPAWGEFGMLVLAGISGGIAQVLLTSSYRYADTSVIAPFEYSSMILALALGFFVFGEVPTPAMLAGAALIVGAGIVIIWRESQLGLERARQRQTVPNSGG